MEFKQLEHFKAVAETENMSQAAEQIYITQSALSKSIAKLENEFGIQLFDRNKNSIRLNENGELVLEDVTVILNQVESLERTVRECRKKAPTLRIWGTNLYHLRYFMSQFSSIYPEVLTDIREASEASLLHGLHTGMIAAGTFDRPQSDPGLVYDGCFADILYISCPLSNPLSQKSSLTMRDLDSQQLLRPADSGYRALQTYLRHHNIHLQLIPISDYLMFREQLPRTDSLAFASQATLEWHKTLKGRKLLPLTDYPEQLRASSYVYHCQSSPQVLLFTGSLKNIPGFTPV